MSFEVQNDTPQSTVGMRRQQRARRRWASSVLVEIRDANEHHCARHHRNQLLFDLVKLAATQGKDLTTNRVTIIIVSLL